MQEAVLKRVYKVGDQEYLLVKVQNGDGDELKLANDQATRRKEKQESDYIKAIYGQKDPQDQDN